MEIETPLEMKPKNKKREGWHLNKDLIDQFLELGPTSKRASQLKFNKGKLADRFEDLGNIWMPVRGYELFLYHYKKRGRP